MPNDITFVMQNLEIEPWNYINSICIEGSNVDWPENTILVFKLSALNFSKCTIEWFALYLREKCVKNEDVKSSLMNNNIGMPQGSILGFLVCLEWIPTTFLK